MNDEIKLKDFYSSCLLRALGYELLRIERYSGNIATFIFADPENDADTALKSYWDKGIRCDARVLIDSIHELKTRLHNQS